MAKKDVVKLKSKKYGIVTIQINPLTDGLGDGYIVGFKRNNKIFTGYADQNKKVIIDFKRMAYDYHHVNGDDMLIAFRCPNGNDRFYHLRKNNNSYEIVNIIRPKIKTQIVSVNNVDSYWLVKTNTSNKVYGLYSIEDGYVIIDGLSDLKPITDNPNHSFYYEKKLYTIDPVSKRKTYVTTICGYLDKECHFSSDILDMNSEGLLYSGAYANNFNSNYFSATCSTIIQKYIPKILEKNKRNIECIKELYHNPIERKKSIVYDFNSRRKV